MATPHPIKKTTPNEVTVESLNAAIQSLKRSHSGSLGIARTLADVPDDRRDDPSMAIALADGLMALLEGMYDDFDRLDTLVKRLQEEATEDRKRLAA